MNRIIKSAGLLLAITLIGAGCQKNTSRNAALNKIPNIQAIPNTNPPPLPPQTYNNTVLGYSFTYPGTGEVRQIDLTDFPKNIVDSVEMDQYPENPNDVQITINATVYSDDTQLKLAKTDYLKPDNIYSNLKYTTKIVNGNKADIFYGQELSENGDIVPGGVLIGFFKKGTKLYEFKISNAGFDLENSDAFKILSMLKLD